MPTAWPAGASGLQVNGFLPGNGPTQRAARAHKLRPRGKGLPGREKGCYGVSADRTPGARSVGTSSRKKAQSLNVMMSKGKKLAIAETAIRIKREASVT